MRWHSPCLDRLFPLLFAGWPELWRLRHGGRQSEPIQQLRCCSMDGDVPQYFDWVESSLHGCSDDGHGQRHVPFATRGHISEDEFPEQNRIPDGLLGKVVGRFDDRVFEESKEFVFKGDQPLADVVGFVVRQRRVPVQFTKSFEDIFSAGTVCFNGQNGVLTMQGNRILNQFFHREQEAFGIRMFLQSGVEKFLDITKEMYQTFLFGECSDLVPVSVPEVGNQDAMVKCAQMINDNLGAPALVDVEKGNERIGENPEPVAFPPGFVGMHESVVRQGLFKSIVKRLAPFGHVFVKADQGGVRKPQIAKTFQRSPGIVIRTFDLVAHERSLGANIRTNESIGNFVFAPTVDNPLAVGTPVVAMDKASGGKFSILEVLLNMLGGMIAGRDSFTAADRTAVKINVERFVDHFRIGARMPLVPNRSSAFGGTFRRIFLLIFGEGILQCVGQFFLEMIRFLFKLFDAFLKLLELMIGEIHGEFKRIDPIAKVLAFRQNALRFLAVKEYAEFAKGTIWAFHPVSVRILWLRPTHVAFPMVNRFIECFLCTI